MRPLWRWLFALALLPLFVMPIVTSVAVHNAAASNTTGGLSVFVGYAEDKEIETPNPAAFPTPWAGSPNTVFLGGTVPGQAACGTLPTCYDTGAIRLDNFGTSPVTVGDVSVDDHSSLSGGKVFDLWGSFTVAPGTSEILAANPPSSNPSYDNFDTSGFPSTCTPLTVAPTVTLTIGGVATTLIDSTHVLDTGGIDRGQCPPNQNESTQWRPIGAAGTNDATLTLGPPTATAVQGGQVTETATLLDGAGTGIPNSTVAFNVVSGPDVGTTGTATTNASGQAAFTYTGSGQGEDFVHASVTTVGGFTSNTATVLWTNGTSTGWTGTDIGNPTPPGAQSFNSTGDTWTVAGSGTGLGGTADQFHFVWQTLSGNGGIAATVTAQSGTASGAQAGVVLRATTDPASPYYAAFVQPGGQLTIEDRTSQGGSTTTLMTTAGSSPIDLWVANVSGTEVTYGSSDGYVWSPLAGSSAAVNLGSAPLAGLAVASGGSTQLNTANFGSVVVTASLPAPAPPVSCPTGWTCGDIGAPALAGSQSYDPTSGTWTIKGAGTDITGTADQFHYVWQPLTGNGSISARVASQSVSSSNAKAGLMVRASTDPGSPNYFLLISPGPGIKVHVRTTQGGGTSTIANPAGTVPVYLKVSWSGQTFSSYTSSDGANWTLIPGSTATVNLGSSFLGGLAVTSHNAGVLSTVTMDTVTTSGSTQPTIPQTISFIGPGTGTFGGTATLSATGGGSGNPVVFSLDTVNTTAGACALSGTNNATVTYTGVGNCVVDANQVGNATYIAATSVSQTIVIGEAPQAPLVVTSTSGTYGSPLPLTTSGGSGTGAVTFAVTSGSASGCTVTASNTLTTTSPGTCVVTATKASDGHYQITSSAATTVTSTQPTIPQTISFIGPGTGTFGGTATLSATGGGSGNPVVFSLDTVNTTAGACALSGTNNATVTYTGVGNCVVDANQVGNATYIAATSVSQTIVIGEAPQAPLVVTSTSGTYGSPLPLTTSGGSGTGAVTFAVTSGSASGCTVTASNTLTTTSPGTCVVTATKASDGHYQITSSAATTVTIGASSSCPTGWTCGDIGAPALAGSQSYDPTSGTWTIKGAGTDITGTADQFHYVWQPLTGNGSISARVASQSVSSSNAKAGLMVRASTDPGSPNYFLLISPGPGIKVHVRTTQGGGTSTIANPAGTVPVYLRVSWSGQTFSSYTSSDGANWTLIPGSTATVNLGSSFLGGLAVTSHNAGVLSTVTMDTVAIG